MEENKFCGCGCKQQISCNKRFVHGHNRKGKKNTEKHNKKISFTHLGSKNPMFGKERPKEVINRIIETKRRKDNLKHSKETCRKISETRKSRHIVHSKETIESTNKKLSLILSEKIANGTFVPNTFSKRGRYVSKITGINECYHSSWELERMKQLDEQGIYWTKNHKIRIPYFNLDEKLRHTIPDFLVSTEPKTIEEVKGFIDIAAYNKIYQTEKFCKANKLNYELLFKEDIFGK